MTEEAKRLDEQLRRVLEGEAWHGPSLLELLADVSAEQAARYPIPGVHSIWELVLHLTGDYSLVLRRMANRIHAVPRRHPAQRVSCRADCAAQAGQGRGVVTICDICGPR